MKVICLVGSISQEREWRVWTELLTRQGNVVFEAGCYWRSPDFDKITPVHQKKIEMSDIVAVIRKKDGSVGEHTSDDIQYARKLGKMVGKVESVSKGVFNDW